jgi:hypothetical protein
LKGVKQKILIILWNGNGITARNRKTPATASRREANRVVLLAAFFSILMSIKG